MMKSSNMGWLPALLLAATSVGCSGKLEVSNDSGTGGAAGAGADAGGSASGGSGTGGSGAESSGGAANGSGGGGTGGAISAGGAGGGSFYPETSFQLLHTRPPEKVDLLFVVDNSIGMGEKQKLLARAVPRLFDQLVNPGDYGHSFNPIDDLHVGVITTSLGGMGGQICTPNGPAGVEQYDASENDRGLLIASIRSDDDLDSYDDLGFLAWDPNGNESPPAETNYDAFAAAFATHVESAGQRGCGYEAPLEAWYHFLIDPSPELNTVLSGGLAGPEMSGGEVLLDGDLLSQREAFLRPDSALMIVMLSDEDDCSILDRGIGYLTSQATLDGHRFNLPASTSACEEDPNGPCCRSCGLNESNPPDGCGSLSDDANCQVGRAQGTDALNLRCYDQKRRFGLDLLHPVSRYVQGLTRAQVTDTSNCEQNDDGEEECPLVDNPLFARDASGLRRDPSQVHLAGIVGVPWQDIATSGSLDGNGLTFKTAHNLERGDVWDLILGDPTSNTSPTDPLMIATPLERGGTHPITGEQLAPATSQDPQQNSINGHEYDNSTEDDLQYACVFPLEEPRDCTSEENASCDCTEADLPKNRPLCNPPGGGAAETTQHYDKAYPGLRQLQVLRSLGEGAALASACPKVADGNAAAAAYGYNPAMDAVVDALAQSLAPTDCLAEALPVDDDGRVACTLLEVGENVDCSDYPNRDDATSEDASAVRADLEALGVCRGSACDDLGVCELQQLSGRALERCQNDPEESDDGYCYVDPGQGVGSESLVDACPSGQSRRLRRVASASSGPAEFLMLRCD